MKPTRREYKVGDPKKSHEVTVVLREGEEDYVSMMIRDGVLGSQYVHIYRDLDYLIELLTEAQGIMMMERHEDT